MTGSSGDRTDARRRKSILLCLGLVALFMMPVPAITRHDIPADVTIYSLVRPAGDRLQVLVRIPLDAMRDTRFPAEEPGFLILDEVAPLLPDAATLWVGDDLLFYENDQPLGDPTVAATRVTLPSDRSFTGFDTALEHVRGPPLDPAIQLHRSAAMVDMLFEYPITSELSDFSLRPRLERLALRVNHVLVFVAPDGAERAFQFRGDPGLVQLDPRWHQAAFSFVRSGFEHILDGIDHLLFLLCLMIPFRSFRTLVPIVTAFTVAHSITLIASALGFAPTPLWFTPLIETLIAASIVWMAFENIVGATVRRRWIMAFGFGLVHGFGFSFALRETLQFAGGHLLTSLFSFNVGVELGQLAVLLIMVPAIELLFRHGVKERIGTILLSAIVANIAWDWMAERAGEVFLYDIPVPVLDGAFLSGVVLWMGAGVILVWGARRGFEALRPAFGGGDGGGE